MHLKTEKTCTTEGGVVIFIEGCKLSTFDLKICILAVIQICRAVSCGILLCFLCSIGRAIIGNFDAIFGGSTLQFFRLINFQNDRKAGN